MDVSIRLLWLRARRVFGLALRNSKPLSSRPKPERMRWRSGEIPKVHVVTMRF